MDSTQKGPTPIYLGLVFYNFFMKTPSQFAIGYTVCIVLGILERLLSLASDSIPLKIGSYWQFPARTILFFVITLLKYVLMIAIMTGYIPLFIVICAGLTLGQLIVEIIKYTTTSRRRNGNLEDQTSKQYSDSNSSRSIKIHMAPLVGQGCC
ncbi:hypothetical protein BB559_000140 [Furculomyces boomerangus]|uniref:Copper transport protein n=2 Tax=Harpellales TaxID=61421 RepID=A0A2T9Z672_9FUNG|nr:hypothetical protein BB559_000140 [Furculomyces boomerangus]PVZ99688.1 hypothetical protein BB558_004284 [Smittium angustum]PWA03358.1 hypothetical protein BB558_000484 [Smittium angustum]